MERYCVTVLTLHDGEYSFYVQAVSPEIVYQVLLPTGLPVLTVEPAKWVEDSETDLQFEGELALQTGGDDVGDGYDYVADDIAFDTWHEGQF